MNTKGKIYLGDLLVSNPPDGSIEITENGTVDISSYETANVNIQSKTQSKSVTPDTTNQDITPDSGFDGLNKVTVIGDANLIADNIKKDVSIFNVTGTYEGGTLPEIINPFNGGTFGTETFVGSITHQYTVSGGTISRCWLLTNVSREISVYNFTTKNSNDLYNTIYIKELGTHWQWVSSSVTTADALLTITDSGLLTITGNRTQSKVNEYPWILCVFISVIIELDTGAILYDYFQPYGNYSCFVKGTSITLFDRTKKNVEDITYDDELLVWDFDNCKFTSTNPLWIQKSMIANNYYKVTLSDGTIINLVGAGDKCHRLFNVERDSFVYAVDMIGEHTIKEDGSIIEVLACENITENVEYYNIITDYHMNLYANGILTSCRYSNLYPITDMKYIKEEKPIIPFELYEGKIDKKWYDGLRLGEQTIQIEETIKYIERLNVLKK